MKKGIRISVFTSLLAVLLVFCSSCFLQNNKPVNVTFWYGLTGYNGEIVKNLITNYNASQKKYVVQGISQPDYDATINKLNTSLAGGELPSLVQVYDIGTQRMVDTKKIIPVQDLIEKDKLDILSDLEPAVASYYTINNRLYSMPFNTSAPVMYFDKTAFKEVGLDVNKKIWTYDELIEAAKKLTKKDAQGKITRYGFGFTLYSWIFEQELATQGVLLADPNNGRQSRVQKLTFNNQAGVQWLNFLKKLIDLKIGKTYGIDGGANSTARDGAFVNAEAAITFNSIASLRGYISNAEKSGKNVDVGVAYLPRPKDAPGGVIIGGASLWITKTGTTEQQEGAWDFVKYVSNPANQAYFSSNTGYYPIRKAAYDVPEMKKALEKYPQFNTAVEELRTTQPGFATQGAVFGTFVKTRVNVQVGIEQFLSGKIPTAQQALDEAAQKCNVELNDYNSVIN